MANPSFGPGHHEILDLPPHEFVRRANAAGIKLAKGAGYFYVDRKTGRKSGCVAGVATMLAAKPGQYGPEHIPAILKLMPGEWTGMTDGFDDHDVRPEKPNRYHSAYAYGSAVRAAALEIQGDLEPGPIKSEGKQVQS